MYWCCHLCQDYRKKRNFVGWRNIDHVLDQESEIVEVSREFPRRVMAVAAFQSPMPLSGSSQQAGLETAFPKHYSLGCNILYFRLLAHSCTEAYTSLFFFFLSLDS